MSRGILGGKQVTKFVNMSSYIAVEFVYFFKSQGRFNSHAKSTVLIVSTYFLWLYMGHVKFGTSKMDLFILILFVL